MRQTTFLPLAGAVLGLATLMPSTASALPTCAELGSNPGYGLVGNPSLTTASTTLVAAAGSNAAYCRVDFVFSEKSGPAQGYAPGQDQAITIRIGLPLSTADSGTGGVQGAWNGKVMNLGGGGLVGNVGNVTSATNGGYVGSSTDSGHPSSENPNFAVIQATNQLNLGRLKDFLTESLRIQYQWALVLARTYYGMPASRNYWSGCSTGGRQGLALALKYGNDFDGFLVGAPATFNSRLQVATLWPWWVNKDIAANSVTSAKFNAANASAIAACDSLDGVSDGILSDPRACTFNATANICGAPGAPAAPNCLTAQEAQATNMMWDGPRNDKGKRIWFPFGYGANHSVSSTATCGNLGSQCWAHKDTTFDWHPLPLSQFDDETQLATNVVAPYSDIMSTTLDLVPTARGAKIIMWHGGADPLIPWRQAAYYYNKALDYYGGSINSWFRFYLAPGVGHCGGGVGPQPQNMFGVLVNWVENGVAPNRILSQSGSRTRPLCPWPQTAIYNGSGSTDDEANFTCGGNIDVNREFVAKYQHETQ